MQSGDIVKGGQQDRMIGVDLIVPARSGKIKIAAFCVEQGRWTKRGSEDSTKFTSSTDRAATRELKLAANKSRSQGEVWAKVARRKKLARTWRSVAAPVSASSSSSPENEGARDAASTSFAAIVDRHRTPSATPSPSTATEQREVYASPALFRKLWPGL